MESFWLCNECSRQLTLHWEPGFGVLAVPLLTRPPAGSFAEHAPVNPLPRR